MGYERYEEELNNKKFEFTGKGGEFFSIWIVNVALTIVTLGIYSAWAKVRTQQYFYGNTFLDGTSFRYTARPLQILKGRIIAFVVFMLYFSTSKLSPLLAVAVLIFIMLLIPAFLVMSMSFRLRNSVYQNVHFNFDKNFKRAYKVFSIPVLISGAYIIFIGLMQNSMATTQNGPGYFAVVVLILMLTIAFMFPWWEFMITKFKVVHTKYGQSDFTFSANTKAYYIMYLKMYGLMLLVFAGVLGLFALLSESTLFLDAAALTTTILILIIFTLYLWAFAYLQAKRTNIMYNNLNVNNIQVRSDLKTFDLLSLYITNTLAIMFSLGLLMPWAKVRTARYRASKTSIDLKDNLDQFVSLQVEKQSAIGEEVGEMFDMDLGF